ncbi:hypothetical protein AB0G00_36865 [Nocardia salmonicida]|uniref:hypothetical protein n=1 Tax=Nocardia salmonicida TaxID=53431 RepID=UPI0033FF996A
MPPETARPVGCRPRWWADTSRLGGAVLAAVLGGTVLWLGSTVGHQVVGHHLVVTVHDQSIEFGWH